jgi:hypothetical protein
MPEEAADSNPPPPSTNKRSMQPAASRQAKCAVCCVMSVSRQLRGLIESLTSETPSEPPRSNPSKKSLPTAAVHS